MKIKDFVSKRSGSVIGRLTRDFGLSLEKFDKQITGDLVENKELGEVARQARLVNHFLPQVVENWKEIIQAQKDYNVAIASLISEGEKYGVAVTKAEAQAVLSESKYNHGISEIEAGSIAAQLLENSRYEEQMEYISMKAEIDQSIQTVEFKDKFLTEANRPYLKQMDENSAYKIAVADHYLQYGETAQPQQINYKNYVSASANPVSRILAKLGLVVR